MRFPYKKQHAKHKYIKYTSCSSWVDCETSERIRGLWCKIRWDSGWKKFPQCGHIVRLTPSPCVTVRLQTMHLNDDLCGSGVRCILFFYLTVKYSSYVVYIFAQKYCQKFLSKTKHQHSKLMPNSNDVITF